MPEREGEVGRTMRARGSETFAKPPLSHERMLEQLESRGLVVPDRDRALRYLRHLGYYRLSPYTIPFQGGDPLTPSPPVPSSTTSWTCTSSIASSGFTASTPSNAWKSGSAQP